ncbi:MAG TPA: phenylacetate--CoA ligase family protein [Gammaproteobacteria bacterium]|nr:phenylacetate--CoA ligase family protein [Gammaproteobacteria bacterium]HIM99305.1 phenylacetate--CoA ligase family protein [Gammaproteobacteria bacterium]
MSYSKLRDNVSIEPRWNTTTTGLECRYLLRDAQTQWYVWVSATEAAVAMGLRYLKYPNAELISEYVRVRHFIEVDRASIEQIVDAFIRYGFIASEQTELHGIEKVQNLERKRIYDQMQLQKMQDVIGWTYEKCAYYSKAFQSHFGGELPRLQTVDDIAHFPRLPKVVFRAEMPNLHPIELEVSHNAFPTSWATSSGTSGNRVQTLTDPNRQKRFVSDCTWQFIADTLPTEKLTKCCVLTTPVCSGTECHMDINRPLSERLISDGRRLILNSFISPAVAGERALNEIVSDITEFKPNVLRGASSYIAALARHVECNKIQLPAFDYVILGWELNSRIHVRLLEKVFGCRVIDEWGATEMMPISTKCAHGNFHVADEHHIEIVREGKPVKPGEVGQILVTSLKRHATPLIRYEIGDLARSGEAHCSCGHPSPIFANIEGRIRDVIFNTAGEPVTPREIDNIVSGETPRDGVEYYALIQHGEKQYRFRYVPTQEVVEGFEATLTSDLRSSLGEDADISFESCREIYPSNSGKFRLTYRDGYDKDYAW